MRVFSLVLLSCISCNALEIPDSCKPLARREGYPTTMTDYEVAQAKAKMQYYKLDPLVIKCLEAITKVERMKRMGK